MRRLIIAVDCDDVLIDTLPTVVKDYNATYGTRLGLKHMYVDPGSIADVFGVKTEQEAIQRFHTIYRRKGYYEALEPISGAVEAIKTLSQHHELHLVTGRQSFLEPATKYTLDRYFPEMFVSVEHTNYYNDTDNKTAIHRSKGEVCGQIHADVLIDDHIAHGKSVLEHGVQRVVLFGDYPWNASDDILPGIVRCGDWDAVLRQIEVLADE